MSRPVCLLLLVFLLDTVQAQPVYLLFRHAEKQQQAQDPPLTYKGRQRAACLADWLAGQNYAEDFHRVYSSDYRRTLETAAPMATRLKLRIRLYDPAKLEDLAAELAGQNAIVVGHSNTTPALAGMLAGQQIGKLDESDYDTAWLFSDNELRRLDLRELGC